MKHTIFKKIAPIIFICFFVFAPLSHDFRVQKAEAVFGVGDTVFEIGQNLFTNIYNTIMTTAEKIKSFGLDGIMWALTNRIIEEMINSTTDWVASGFEGDPAFVTDLEGFLLDTADVAAGEFLLLEEGPLQFLCSPFKLDIALALDLQYRGRGPYYKPECTLSDIAENIDNFLRNDFSDGGWQRWANMTLDPYGNAYGSTFGASAEYNAYIAGARGTNESILRMGSGFFSDQSCEDVNGDGKYGTGECVTNTPGTVIEGVLNDALDMPNKRLTVADELDELVGALMTQFVSKALDFAGFGSGLRGFSADRDNLTPIPKIPDTNIEIGYMMAQEELMSLILQTQVFCEVNHNSGLPLTVKNLYDDLRYRDIDGGFHTEVDINELTELYGKIEPALTSYRNGGCRDADNDIWLEFSLPSPASSTPSLAILGPELNDIYDPNTFEPTDEYDPDLSSFVDTYGDEVSDIYEPPYPSPFPYNPGAYSIYPSATGPIDPYAEEKDACWALEDTKWDFRCNACVPYDQPYGDICNWNELPRSFDCDEVAGDSCTETCDTLGGTYDSREDSCVFMNVEVRDSIRYCDPADTYDSLMTPEECLDSCTYSMETKYDFDGFIISPKTKREKFSEDPEYWRQWCWATYKKLDVSL